jgi:hypothetical protein
MIETLAIRNFRGFRSVALEGLKRFNVIVGPNASGKTALLEAIFLACVRTPEATLRLKAWRGMGDKVAVGDSRASFEALWTDVFFNQHDPIVIEFKDSVQGRRALTVAYSTESAMTLPPGEQRVPLEVTAPLTFEWRLDGRTEIAEAKLTKEKGLEITSISSYYQGVFVHGGPRDANENAKRFSDLSKRKRHLPVVEAVKNIFPMIRDLSVEIEGPDRHVVYADVEGIENKMPLPLISAGINRYLSILLAICAFPGGVVLVDEIENGFYYSAMPKLLASLLLEAEANRNNTQLFMSTHSMEFLSRIWPSIKEYRGDFCLLRTGRSRSGECTVEQIPGNVMEAAIDQNLEIR